MEKRTPGKLRVGIYRFWIEYNQFFHGGTTPRLRKRAKQRKVNAGADFGRRAPLDKLDLAGFSGL
ncbi:hypothetical protein [Arundinibacter roseus]|uniref:Uncharacterized protein n=1 Tax=Arundinibacter roseus TaxID=2070510 RepID=A0A4R4K2I2_9BACT|nr:hypothetical protein [Arundinibacter roseus]TDB61433.1 hypothetical protein EZE20_19725 [Arundinibacter roseus]